MQHKQPRGLSRRRVGQLLSKTKSERSAGNRIEAFSRHFLGCPYTANPLVGSRTEPEVFVASFDGFDCVTYIETILALARASDVCEFEDWLRKIRYENGSVKWTRRKHYMSEWIRINSHGKKPLKIVAPKDVPKAVKKRVLDDVPDLPRVPVRFECIPKPAIRKLAPYLQTGDFIFFA